MKETGKTEERSFTLDQVNTLLQMQIDDCAYFAQRCARDKGMASKEYHDWIKETPITKVHQKPKEQQDKGNWWDKQIEQCQATQQSIIERYGEIKVKAREQEIVDKLQQIIKYQPSSSISDAYKTMTIKSIIQLIQSK